MTILILIDEVFTPDSSRFWPKDEYEPGKSQSSFDKQYVRDYLSEVGWNKEPPAPHLPEDVIHRTSEKYLGGLSIDCRAESWLKTAGKKERQGCESFEQPLFPNWGLLNKKQMTPLEQVVYMSISTIHSPFGNPLGGRSIKNHVICSPVGRGEGLALLSEREGRPKPCPERTKEHQPT